MTAGSTSLPSVSFSGSDIVVAIYKPLTVFELVSAYGTVGLSLGLPMVGLFHTVDFQVF